MVGESLLGHLTARYAPHPENWATESLLYILDRSAAARDGLHKLAALTGLAIPPDLRFRSQALAGDKAIPDLVGETSGGAQPLIIEAKFWAGLTEHQPVTYLKRLFECEFGLLLVIAPKLRFPTLWHELMRRIHGAGLSLDERTVGLADMRVADVGPNHTVALASWHAVLDVLVSTLTASGDHRLAEDVRQLQGVADAQDTDAFLPVQPHELSPMIPSRLWEFIELAEEVAQEALNRGWCTNKGLTKSSMPGVTGRYLLLDHSGLFFGLNIYHWFTYAETPFWMTIAGKDWKAPVKEQSALAQWQYDQPSRLFVNPADSRLLVPLFVPFGVERAQVREDLLSQFGAVRKALTGIHDMVGESGTADANLASALINDPLPPSSTI